MTTCTDAGNAYNADAFKVQADAGKHYSCCMSMYCLDLLSLAMPHLPVRETGITELVDLHFSSDSPPGSWPDSIRVVSGNFKQKPPFKKLSGDEVLAAALWRCATVVKQFKDPVPYDVFLTLYPIINSSVALSRHQWFESLFEALIRHQWFESFSMHIVCGM